MSDDKDHPPGRGCVIGFLCTLPFWIVIIAGALALAERAGWTR